MKPNCSETLGFELRALAEKRDAEVTKFRQMDYSQIRERA